MTVWECVGFLRDILVQSPSYVFHYLFAWIYPVRILRSKAAVCPYPRVRRLILQRSGVRLGRLANVGHGVLVVGIGRSPPALVLGDRVAVSPYVTFVTSSYPDDSLLCLHPEVRPLMNRLGPIHVEDDAWIGAGAIILPGITIGRGAIVGAGAVVLRDVPPYTIVAGVPARVLRSLHHDPKGPAPQGEGRSGAHDSDRSTESP